VFPGVRSGDAGQVESPAFVSLLKRLRELREAHGLTQEAFAEQCGFSYKYYQAVEAGRKRELRFSTLERFANAYGIEIWQLLAPPFPRTRLNPSKRTKVQFPDAPPQVSATKGKRQRSKR